MSICGRVGADMGIEVWKSARLGFLGICRLFEISTSKLFDPGLLQVISDYNFRNNRFNGPDSNRKVYNQFCAKQRKIVKYPVLAVNNKTLIIRIKTTGI